MTVKNNKTTMLDEYINNNLDMLINSTKTLEELCEDFNQNNNNKVSFSSFYNVFKDITKERGLKKKRTRKTKEEMEKKHQRMLNEEKKETKALMESQNKEITKQNIRLNNLDDFSTIQNTTIKQKIYGIERFLNKHQAQTFEMSKDFPNPRKYSLIVDMDRRFSINDILYAPVLCILSKPNIYTSEEYNELFKTSHPKKQNKYINVVRMKPGTYSYKFYVVEYYNDSKYIMPFCKTGYIEYEDITELIKYGEDTTNRSSTQSETEETEYETEYEPEDEL